MMLRGDIHSISKQLALAGIGHVVVAEFDPNVSHDSHKVAVKYLHDLDRSGTIEVTKMLTEGIDGPASGYCGNKLRFRTRNGSHTIMLCRDQRDGSCQEWEEINSFKQCDETRLFHVRLAQKLKKVLES